MASLSPKLRVIQAGVGNFGRRRRELLREAGLFELAAVYDWNRAALEAAAREEGCRAAGSYEELLETPGAEAVILSTGARYHAEQIVQAARRGLHVFVEKPVCALPGEIDQLLEAGQESGVVIAVGHIAHDSDGVSRTIKDLIEEGELGKIATFQKITAHNGGLHIKEGDWRGDPERNPGGMLFQCGVHGLHELMYYFGPVAEVSATMRWDVHTTRTADIAHCSLRFASGLVGTLSAFHVTPYLHALNIFGDRASLYRDDRFFDEGTHMELQRGRMDGGPEARTPIPACHPTDPCGNLRSFYHAIVEGLPCTPSLADGLKAVQVVFAAQRSAESGRPVEIEPLSPTEENAAAVAA